MIEPKDQLDYEQKIIGSGKGYVPHEIRGNMPTDIYNRLLSEGCKTSVAKNIATKKDLAKAREQLVRLKAKVAQ